jgi:hypothetical protein
MQRIKFGEGEVSMHHIFKEENTEDCYDTKVLKDKDPIETERFVNREMSSIT